jgi:hypothetical protein
MNKQDFEFKCALFIEAFIVQKECFLTEWITKLKNKADFKKYEIFHLIDEII